MTHHRKWIGVIAALALVAAACGGDDEGAAEADESEPVIVGGIFDLSGATGDVGTPYAEGARDYTDWRNSTQDGVGGRPLELEWQDYAYDVAIAEQLYSQFVSEGAVAIQGWGTGDTEALRDLVTNDEIPFMSASWSEELVDPSVQPYNFVVGPTYSDQMRVALNWIAEDSGGSTEVAAFHHDSPFGTSPIADGQAHIDAEGLDLGYEAYPMPDGATDYVGELSRAQSQGAEYVVIQTVSSPAAQLQRDIEAQGMDMQVVCLNWCSGELFIELAGDDAEGMVGVHPFTPVEGDAEGLAPIAEYLESDDEGESLEDKDIFYVQGWYTMHAMVEAIAEAVEAGGEVDGPAIRDALETMGAVDTGGVSQSVEFSTESHRGMTSPNLYEVSDGVLTLLEAEVAP